MFIHLTEHKQKDLIERWGLFVYSHFVTDLNGEEFTA